MATRAHAAPAAVLRTGAAVGDITPTASMFLYGYPHVPRTSTGVHDRLECAALYVEEPGGAALFLAHDLIYFTKAFVADLRRSIARRSQLPEDAIMITATHTHSGPIMSDHLANAADTVLPKADANYFSWLAGRIESTALAAIAAAAPAEIGLEVARAEGVGSNRHDPRGPADPEVPVLLFRRRDNRQPIGCMVVYSMHPTVLHEDSTLFSGDFPYFARRFLQRGPLGANCPVLYHNGTSGNQSPRHMTRANTFAEAERLGETLGRSMAAAIAKLSFRPAAGIRVRRQWLDLAPRQFPSEAEALAALQAARERFERLQREGAPRQAVRTAECDVFGAEETAELSRAARDGRLAAAIASCTPAEIQVISIGPWNFVGWPGEFFVEYGLALKARIPHTYVITLANGELQGYVVTPEAAARKVYESTNALFAPANGDRFVETTAAMLSAP